MVAWIKRESGKLLQTLANLRPAVVVTGARQTGKTALVRHLFHEHSYVSLDLPSEAEQAERAPQSFLSRHKPPVIIDEVQYAPGLFRHLKAEIDKNREINGRFVLTGSQKFALMTAVSDSLAGRIGTVELEGLSWTEIRSANSEVTPELAGIRGYLPELWQKPELDSTGYYRDYLSTYLERDLRGQLEVGSLRDFERFIRACGLRSGALLNKAELARDVSISPSTAGAWLSVLEASNQLILLEPWFSNRTKSLVKTPKLYLCDPGMLAFLLGIRSYDDLLRSPYAGAFWETCVCAELRKKLRLSHRGELYFWRDRTKEVDFLIHRAGRFELLDAKWSEHPSSGDAANLERTADELPAGSVVRSALICRAQHSYPVGKRSQAIPLGEA